MCSGHLHEPMIGPKHLTQVPFPYKVWKSSCDLPITGWKGKTQWLLVLTMNAQQETQMPWEWKAQQNNQTLLGKLPPPAMKTERGTEHCQPRKDSQFKIGSKCLLNAYCCCNIKKWKYRMPSYCILRIPEKFLESSWMRDFQNIFCIKINVCLHFVFQGLFKKSTPTDVRTANFWGPRRANEQLTWSLKATGGDSSLLGKLWFCSIQLGRCPDDAHLCCREQSALPTANSFQRWRPSQPPSKMTVKANHHIRSMG